MSKWDQESFLTPIRYQTLTCQSRKMSFGSALQWRLSALNFLRNNYEKKLKLTILKCTDNSKTLVHIVPDSIAVRSLQLHHSHQRFVLRGILTISYQILYKVRNHCYQDFYFMFKYLTFVAMMLENKLHWFVFASIISQDAVESSKFE